MGTPRRLIVPIVLACLAAFGLDRLDRRLRRLEDVERSEGEDSAVYIHGAVSGGGSAAAVHLAVDRSGAPGT